MCHVITTEYRTCVHCIHVMYHLICDALVHVIYFVASGQYSYSILLYNWVLFLRLFFFSFQKTFIYITTITQQVIQSCSLAPMFAFRWSFIFATNKSPNLNFLNIMLLPQGWRDIWNSCFGWTKSRLGRCMFMHKPTRMIKL